MNLSLNSIQPKGKQRKNVYDSKYAWKMRELTEEQ
jgi:hypothetical protein